MDSLMKSLMDKKFVYGDKYIKTKIRSYGGEIKTKF